MFLYQEKKISPASPCPYLEGREQKFEYFFASGLDSEELSFFLSRGWRKFGIYYFRPACGNCRECRPIRVRAADFRPSTGQTRVLRKGSEIEFRMGPLEYRPEIFSVYSDHSLKRFGRTADEDDFKESFYMESCPSLQSEYYLDGKLFAVGFLDAGIDGLSSVYFSYYDGYSKYSPGVYGAIAEIRAAAGMGLDYYYLGYYIRGNGRMSYKNRFYPHELYDTEKGEWGLREIRETEAS